MVFHCIMRFDLNGLIYVILETLNLNKDFRRAYWRGKSYAGSRLVTYVLPNRSGKIRVGITTGKKIGGAVQRNRARRVIKAAFGSCLPGISGSADIVFVARVKTVYSKSTKVEEDMRAHLREAGLL